MSALHLLEQSTQLDDHLAAHEYAERIYERVLMLVEDGCPSNEIRDAVKELHRRAREEGRSVQRDAYVEVLDALDEEYPTGRERSDLISAA